MQTKQALVIISVITLMALLRLSPKAVDMDNPPVPEQSPPVDTNCYTAYTSNWCKEGKWVFTNVTLAPYGENVCVGTYINAYCDRFPSNGVEVVTTTCTNASGASCTNCPAPVTNYFTPDTGQDWWLASGAGATPTGGLGVVAQFTVYIAGTGAVMLARDWKHYCDTNVQTTSLSSNVTVHCPVMTCQPVVARCDTRTGGHFLYCYNTCQGAGWSPANFAWSEEISVDPATTCPTELEPPVGPTPLATGCVTDYVYMKASPEQVLAQCECDYCAVIINQTIRLTPLAYPDIVSCTYNNTLQITVNGTNRTVTTTSYGTNTLCTW